MKIKDWSKFQHFKDRNPPWIKLYRELLDDQDWHYLDPESAKILVMLWLLASEDKNKAGELPSVSKIAFRLRMDEQQVRRAVNNLSHWLILDDDTGDITPISSRYQTDTEGQVCLYQDDAPETETETELLTKEEGIKGEFPSGGDTYYDDDGRERFWGTDEEVNPF